MKRGAEDKSLVAEPPVELCWRCKGEGTIKVLGRVHLCSRCSPPKAV